MNLDAYAQTPLTLTALPLRHWGKLVCFARTIFFSCCCHLGNQFLMAFLGHTCTPSPGKKTMKAYQCMMASLSKVFTQTLHKVRTVKHFELVSTCGWEPLQFLWLSTHKEISVEMRLKSAIFQWNIAMLLSMIYLFQNKYIQ